MKKVLYIVVLVMLPLMLNSCLGTTLMIVDGMGRTAEQIHVEEKPSQKDTKEKRVNMPPLISY